MWDNHWRQLSILDHHKAFCVRRVMQAKCSVESAGSRLSGRPGSDSLLDSWAKEQAALTDNTWQSQGSYCAMEGMRNQMGSWHIRSFRYIWNRHWVNIPQHQNWGQEACSNPLWLCSDQMNAFDSSFLIDLRPDVCNKYQSSVVISRF